MELTMQLKRITEANFFQAFFTFVILFAAVLVGIGTYPAIEAKYGAILGVLDLLVIVLFTVEVGIKIAAHGATPWRFFKDPWNVFDFMIVAVGILFLLPLPLAGGQFIPALRVVRVLRVLRLLTAIPSLRFVVDILIGSFRYMGPVSVLIAILFYVYAVVGVSLFGSNDPEHFGTLQASLLTLFGLILLDGVTDTMKSQIAAAPISAVLYFVSFVLFGTMMVLNLFVGIMMRVIEEQKEKGKFQ